MNTDQQPLLEDTQLTPIPLTPDDIAKNHAIVKMLLGKVFCDELDNV